MPPRRRPSKAAARKPVAEVELNPIAKRIGPIFDPAWLKLVDEKTLREIAVLQLEGVKEMLDVERRTVEQIRSTLAGKGR